MHDGMVFGVPGKKWFEDGRIVGYPKKAAVAWRMLLSIADFGKDVLGAALEDAGLTVDEVQFYASHQATAWFRAVTQEHAGMHDAKSTDTFPWAGSLSAANIPLVLAIGEREGLLKHGDIVAAYSGGNGITYSGLTMRWGVE